MGKSLRKMSPSEQIAAIRAKLGHLDCQWTPTRYLKTGWPELDSVFGSPVLGIPYGKMIELSGPESNGKSAIALDMSGIAQRDGAQVFWLDAENSFDSRWAELRHVDTDHLFLFSPYVGQFAKSKEPRLITAQELCSEVEAAIMLSHKHSPDASRLLVVDSVTALLTREEAEAGIADQNMRTKLALASFLNQLLRRWVGMCQSTNTTILFINQLRINPTQLFGNPEYSPGGKAMKFYCHVRVKCRRAKGGKLMKGGKQVGIKGILVSAKNKVGGEEGYSCGYKLYWKGKSLYPETSVIQKG